MSVESGVGGITGSVEVLSSFFWFVSGCEFDWGKHECGSHHSRLDLTRVAVDGPNGWEVALICKISDFDSQTC